MARLKAPIRPLRLPIERKTKKNPDPNTLVIGAGGAIAYTNVDMATVEAEGAYAILAGDPNAYRPYTMLAAWKSVIGGAYSTSKKQYPLLPPPVQERVREAALLGIARKLVRGEKLNRNEHVFFSNQLVRTFNQCVGDARYMASEYWRNANMNNRVDDDGYWTDSLFHVISNGKKGETEHARVVVGREEQEVTEPQYAHGTGGRVVREQSYTRVTFTPRVIVGGLWYTEVYCKGLAVIPCEDEGAAGYSLSAVVLRVLTDKTIDGSLAVMALRQRTPSGWERRMDEAPALITPAGKLRWLPFRPTEMHGTYKKYGPVDTLHPLSYV